ncbi:MAG: hypothetical protein HONDAALG_02419 [Gammaproteobacteria bacterium]|nr:hypothetical protein [Gammaproteobacteria bacterium]
MPSQIEEVLADADLIGAEDIGPDSNQRFFNRSARRFKGRFRLRPLRLRL